MEKKTIKEKINETFENVPLNERKRYIIIFCISIFFVTIFKTFVSISKKESAINTEWVDSTNVKNYELLRNELETVENDLKRKKDSLQNIFTTIDSFNLQLEEKNEKKQ